MDAVSACENQVVVVQLEVSILGEMFAIEAFEVRVQPCTSCKCVYVDKDKMPIGLCSVNIIPPLGS